jgi:N6-L-threonylcarbamoyladenine synthase
VGKTARALDDTGLAHLVVAGGVSANRALREALQSAATARGVAIYFPRLEFCTDNAAMIAVAGLARLKAGGEAKHLAIEARAQWPLMSLQAPGVN